MKCKDCPLLIEYGHDYESGDCDVGCAANYKSYEFPKKPSFFDHDVNGCTRSNKWISKQNKGDLIAKHYEYDAECWAAYPVE